MPRVVVFLLFAVGVAATANAATVRGTVFIDRDGDGVLSAADETLPDVVVAFEDDAYTTTDALGTFALTTTRDGIVWVRTPDGYSPEPTWRAVSGTADQTVDLELRPLAVSEPLRFVITADIHLGTVNLGQARQALGQADEMVPAPTFMTVIGDLADERTDEGNVHDYLQAVADIPYPIVPVPGNHDWQDNGARYRKFFGPPLYSFDVDGVHFLVLNFMDLPASLAFARHDLADVPEAQTTVVLIHWLPDQALAEELASLGVDYVYTGHSHFNRSMERAPGMIEVNTEALVFGGLFFTPSGFRVVERSGSGFSYEHHVTVDRPVVHVMSPRDGSCLPAGRPFEVVASIENGATSPGVTVRIDGGAPIALARTGGWTFAAESNSLPAGAHDLVLAVSVAGSPRFEERSHFCVVAAAGGEATLVDWPQLQGGPTRVGAASARLAPPIAEAWTRSTGGHIIGASPVLAGRTLVVPVVDLDYMTAGGVAAFDARSGELLWEDRVGPSVHDAPAIADDVVVFSDLDAVLYADDLQSGHRLWSVDLGAGAARVNVRQFSSAVIADGEVMVWLLGEVYAFDLRTGAPAFSVAGRNPVPHGGFTSPAVAGDIGVCVVGRDQILAWDMPSGQPRWVLADASTVRLQSTPIIAEGMVFIAGSDGLVTAVDLPTSDQVWSRRVYQEAGLGYLLLATPAYAAGRLFVPGPSGPLFALNAATGEELWRVEGGAGVVRPFMYRSEADGFYAAAAVAGDVVWAGGVDGRLRAIAAADGEELATFDLGAPVLSGVVPAGDMLFVGTFDGTVHAFRAVVDGGVLPPVVTEPQPEGGCAVSAGRSAPRGWTCLLLALVLARRRRSARTRAPAPPAGKKDDSDDDDE